MNHLLDIKSLSKSDIENLIATAEKLKKISNFESRKWHQGKSAMALFFENSTRTLMSFQLACQRLGIDFSALNIAHSSVQKGEDLRDTLLTLNAMKPDLFIIRHQQNNIHEEINHWLSHKTSIINAGDGTNQHPTQGLLDLYTIYQHKHSFEKLKIAIIGDIKHSRVANSLMDGLSIMGTTNIQVYAPDSLIPENRLAIKASSMQSALSDCDVVVMLRIQKERLGATIDINFEDWHHHYGLSEDQLKFAKPNAIVMHPGPMNRGVEITNKVADGSQSVIFDQVTNGVIMRQAMIHHILTDS